MTDVLRRTYDALMDRPGATDVLAALADGELVRVAELSGALGVPLGQLRDRLMALQPLLLRVDPGTADELVGVRHPSIAEHIQARTREHITEDELWLYFDDELPDDRRATIAAHLDYCDVCAETALGIDILKRTVARCGGERAPAELVHRIRASIRGDQSRVDS